MGAKQTRHHRSNPLDVEILRSGVLLSLHANPRHLPAGLDPLPVGVPSNVGVANAEGAAEAFARQDHVHNRVYPINRLAGVLGVASGWTTVPTNLERCTDDDWATPTGTGSIDMGGGGVCGDLDFDMGAVFNVHVRFKVMYGNTVVGGVDEYFRVKGSIDNVNFYECRGTYTVNTLENEERIIFGEAFVHARYLQLEHQASAAGVSKFAAYEIQAIDCGV